MLLAWLTMSWFGWEYITSTSLFWSAGTSWAWSVMMLKISLSSGGLTLPYHFGFGVSTTDWSFVYLLTMNGPPDQVGTFLSNHRNEACRPAALPSSPCCLAMCAGYSVPNMLCQSANGLAITTVTVLPPSEPL